MHDLINYITEFCPNLAREIKLDDEECDKLLDQSRNDFLRFIKNLVKLDDFAGLGMIKEITYSELSLMITKGI